jgi:uncharacterized membrane protein YcaP (DUF421 family)
MWDFVSSGEIFKVLNVRWSDFHLLFRTLILFVLCLVAIRLMGKRTIAQLSPFDLLSIIIIGSAVAVPMEDEKVPFVHGLIPIFAITLVNYLLQLLILRNRKVENFLQGTPSVLVKDGEIILKNLKKERMSLADLSILLREKNIRNVNQVQEATLEPNGKLSITRVEKEEPITLKDLGLPGGTGIFPTVVVDNGDVVFDNLSKTKLSLLQLVSEVQQRGVENLQEIAQATLDEKGNLQVVRK